MTAQIADSRSCLISLTGVTSDALRKYGEPLEAELYLARVYALTRFDGLLTFFPDAYLATMLSHGFQALCCKISRRKREGRAVLIRKRSEDPYVIAVGI